MSLVTLLARLVESKNKNMQEQLVQKNCYRTRITPLSLCLQCHPARDGQRGKCWCVDQKTGLRLPGPLELRGDLDCHQLIASLRD